MYVNSTRTSAKREVHNERNAKRDDQIARLRRAQTFVAGFVLAILMKNSFILSRDSFMLKKYQVLCF